MLLNAKARDKVTSQIKAAADRIGASLLACLGIAVGALLLAAGALVISVRALRAVRAA